MRIQAEKISNESQLVADYKQNKAIVEFFDYPLDGPLENRIAELKKRTYKRKPLVEVLLRCNEAWGAGEKTLAAIKKLENPDTVAVVGGQQAGLLTGPLYTINKVLSIIQFAREKEEKLGVPVLPIFWIAGEDHDFAEINHIYLPTKNQMMKYKLKQSVYKKTPISTMEFDKEALENWLSEVFSALPETDHTKDIYGMANDALRKAQSFTDFFAIFLHRLFNDSGIILLDSADEEIRRIESDYFVQLIENQPKISQSVYETSQQLLERGYPITFDPDPSDGHLFYHLKGERILLKRTDSGSWVGKMDEGEWSTEELLETAKTNPQLLSNNVVTRPLMQELLIPTLAFIAGPGEIAYWSQLGSAFHVLNVKMPPVIPRLSYTFVTEEVRKALENTGVSITTALNRGAMEDREKWLLSKQEPPIEALAEEIKQSIGKVHEPLKTLADRIRADVSALADKNLMLIHREIDFLANRMKLALEEKHQKELEQYDLIEMMLHPDGGLQERVWNILPFLNKYGNDFLERLVDSRCTFEEQHYIVHL